MKAVCAACKAEYELGWKFCGECGAVLPRAPVDVSSAGNPRMTRRQMTVLFCDLVGSTQLAERVDPEDLLDVLSAYGDLVKRVAARFGGFVARIVGDGADVYFGYPMAGEDDAVRAVHAGLAIVEEVSRLKGTASLASAVQVRVGIATGLVAVGVNEAIAIAGGTPNLAARIQAQAQPGQVAISPSTRRIAGSQFEYQDLGTFELKGFDEPVRLTAVTGSGVMNSRSAWRGHDARSPLVGRETELAELLDCWKVATSPQITGALIVAEAGLGKSRLATELDRRLDPIEHTTLRLQCSPFHANSVLNPWVQHLAIAAGFTREDASLSQLEKLEAQLAIAGIENDLDLSLVAALMGIPGADRYPPVSLPPPAQLQMTKEALQRYVVGLAGRPSTMARTRSEPPLGGVRGLKPVLLILEDLHWIDPTSLELIDQILAGPQVAPILLLMTTRPEARPELKTEPRLISLARLGEQASRAIAMRVAAEIGLADSAIDTIIQRSDGVPLYIEEMTRMVMESHGSLCGAADLRLTDIPDTLLDLLMERLDRLGAAKWLAQVGAVIGHEFSRRLLFAAADMGRDPFDEALNAMLDASLVLPGDDAGERFVFRHALIEDAAYGSIVPRTRTSLHGRVADVLMHEFADDMTRQPEIAARHLSRASRYLEASRYFLEAGRQALARGAPREAAAHLHDGVATLSAEPSGLERSQSELALLSILGPTTMVLQGPGSQQFHDVQRRAFALCHELPGAPCQFPITYGLCLYHWGRAELETARVLASGLLSVAQSKDHDAEAVMAANTMMGMIKLSLGDAQAARAHLERSVARYDPKRDAALYPVYLMDFGVFGRFYLALATFISGDEGLASMHVRDAYELAGGLNQPHTLGFSMAANCTLAVWRDQPALALQFAEQCIDFSSRLGFSEFIGLARIARGWATARCGQLSVGLDDIEAGIRLWNATGFENWQSWFAFLRAEVLMELGRGEEALRDIEHQIDRIHLGGERVFHSLLLAQKASLLSTDPATSGACMRLLREAKELASAQRAVAWTSRIDAIKGAIHAGTPTNA
jgi:class 3 adenylate cyclase